MRQVRRLKTEFTHHRILILSALSLIVCCIAWHGYAEEPQSRDRFKEDLAGNDDVARVIKNFAGKGVVGDDSAPTPAEDALPMFEMGEGLKMELVAAEPEVRQPLDMHFDAAGRLWVVEYLQYPFPEGLKVIRYDQYLRAVFDKVPQPPPHHVRGKDQLRVFTDTDNDGTYDSSFIAIDGLNIASSVATGYGGIWVLNPPYLLFYPDADADGKPDSDPVVKLSGFGLEDTHSVANSMQWGPDGWLYAANGSTTTGSVSSQTTKNVHWEGQNIWRYHPTLDIFEIYAEGGGNTFSTEIDIRGRMFSGTNHGNTRGMYYPQGSYGEKNWGKHGPLTNPYAFGFFKHMTHEGDKDRFAQTFVIYEGGTLPERYHGNVVAANALHNRVWASQLIPAESSYRTVDMPNVAYTHDHWFRPVDVKVGPDGAVYLADWYDSRLSHVDPRDNWHKESGRIYRVQSQTAQPIGLNLQLAQRSSDELMALFTHHNKWQRQTAVRVLSERIPTLSDDVKRPLINTLRELATADREGSLEALWTLSQVDAFDFALAEKLLQAEDQHLRRWTIRLLGDRRELNSALAEQLQQLANTEAYVQVRSQLASSAKRFATPQALPILFNLLARTEDAADPHQPLLLWWGVEAHAGLTSVGSPHVGIPLHSELTEPPLRTLIRMLHDPALWELPLVQDTILSRLMQRLAMASLTASQDEREAYLQASAELLQLAPQQSHREQLMAGFLEAYAGREIVNLPAALQQGIEEYQQQSGQSEIVLGLRLGNEDALKQSLNVIRDTQADVATRLEVIKTLGELHPASAVSSLLGLLSGGHSSAIKRAAMEALMNFTNPEIGSTICSRYHSSIPNEHQLRETAQRVLASRPAWARQLLAEVAAFRIKATDIGADVVQQMRLHDDPELQQLLDKFWGKTRATPEEKRAEIARLAALIKSPGERDPAIGKALFTKNCATCHTLFGEGGKTGPNLTGYERTNLDFLLLAIADPSAGIREEFTQFQIATADGRVLTGLLEEQTPTTISVRGVNNQLTVINRDDVDVLKAMDISIMPDELTRKLTDPEILHLFAYLMQPTPIAQ